MLAKRRMAQVNIPMMWLVDKSAHTFSFKWHPLCFPFSSSLHLSLSISHLFSLQTKHKPSVAECHSVEIVSAKNENSGERTIHMYAPAKLVYALRRR